MKICVDISQIVYKGTGVARYTRMLVESILRYDKKNEYIFFFSSLRQKLDSHFKKKIRERHTLKKFPFPPTVLDILWNRMHYVSINQLIRTCDIFVASDWTQPPVAPPMRSLTIVHDLVYLRYPETLHPKIVAVQKRRMQWVKKEVDHIIADSKSTRRDLMELLGIDDGRISVVYPAVHIDSPTDAQVRLAMRKYGVKRHFILSVGKLEPRKNIKKLTSAFQKAKLKNIDLLVVGPEGWSTKNSKFESRKSKVEKKERFLGYVQDQDLAALYSKALFFIYPSIYEGFGYPVVEAMALGCPVATSNTSSLKEIAEGYGLLFDPDSEDEIADVITKLANDSKLREEFAKKGKKRAGDFSAENFTQNLLQVMKRF